MASTDTRSVLRIPHAWPIVGALIAVGALAGALPAADPVVIHEWGTFTALHDDNGQAIGGINTDDEPLPPFAHDVAKLLLIRPTQLPPRFFQGAPSCHRDVTMRLETPVLYFHPATATPFAAEVEVAFIGGWLTQYYPDARCVTPGLDPQDWTDFGALRADTRGSLTWSGLTIGGAATGPQTTDHVWLAPRQAQAAAISTAAGEHEKFLFYRGVAHLDAPISVVRPGADRLEVHSHLDDGQPPLAIPHLWLADIRGDGRIAFRELPGVTLGSDRAAVLASTAAEFTAGDYGDGRRLRDAMRTALIAAGLFADEAQAQLDTWEVSYFTSRGLRLFFLLPQAWTERVLPLSVSLSDGLTTQVTRTMVGRIELVTPAQRRLLEIIAAGPASDAAWLRTFLYGDGQPHPEDPHWYDRFQDRWRRADSGDGSLVKSGAPVPADYAAYLELGRFRNALLLEEQRLRPQPTLARFIANYALEAYSPHR